VFICIFNIAGSRLRRYSSGVIYEKTYPNTVFKFNFNTPDWDISPTKTAVFSYRGKNYHEPLDENNMCKVPGEVLHEGYFLVSVQDGRGLLTNNVRVPVAPMPEELLPDVPGSGGDCDCGPSMVYVPTIDDKKVLSWTVQEAAEDMPVPSPVDLNPNDDWVEDETMSEYEWEEDV
jgi:hypothetical protein